MTPKGVIYDPGYRRYEGRYLGRGYAIGSLMLSDLKRALGIGKGVWYKAFLWLFVGIILIQAIMAFFFDAIAGGRVPSSLAPPHSLLFDMANIIFLFLSAMVAPDLLCSDRKSKVLSLYLVRPIELYDYLLAKGAVLFGFVTLVAFVPQLGIFIAKALTAPDALKYFAEHGRDLGAAFVASLIYALFYGALAMAISSLTVQQGYATAAIIIVPNLLGLAAGLLWLNAKNNYWQLLDISGLPSGVKNALLGISPAVSSVSVRTEGNEQVISFQPLEWWVYLLALAAIIAISWSIVLVSYAKERP